MHRSTRFTLALLFLIATSSIVHADVCAPAKVVDLAVAGMGKTTAVLTFTDPGDDCSTGTATSFEVRYSTSAITEANYYNASVAGTHAPLGSNGTADCWPLPVNTLTCGSHLYYFAITFTDASGNRSPVSNSPSGTTHSCVSAEVECP